MPYSLISFYILNREGRDSNSSGLNGEKRYSKAMAEDNWRNRAAPAEESDSSSESKPTHSGEDGKNEDGETNPTPSSNWRNSSEKTPSSGRDNWSTSKSSYQSSAYNERHSRDSYSKEKSSSRDHHQPEWLDDDDEENTMTFDKSGNFVSVKEMNKSGESKEKSAAEKRSGSNSRSQSRDTESNEPRTSESETTTNDSQKPSDKDDNKKNESEVQETTSNKSDEVEKVEQQGEETSTAEQEQQRLLDEKLNQMSLNDVRSISLLLGDS